MSSQSETEVKWTDKGATVSILNAVKEFPILTLEIVQAAIRNFDLEKRQSTYMGTSYTKLFRWQVIRLVKKVTDSKSGALTEKEKLGELSECRPKSWNDKGTTISDKNAIKEFPG
jgi:hypothetical protein